MALATATPELAMSANGMNGSFPKKLRRGRFSRLEPRFTILFGALLLIISITIMILSHAKIDEEAYSEKAMLKIQERYAQFVLNQPAPVVEEIEKKEVAKVETAAKEQTAEAETEKKEEVHVDRAKETFAEKQVRKETGVDERRQKREENVRQIQTSGLFAALTASGGSGPGSSTADLLGTAGVGVSNLGDLTLSKGTFATKNVDAADLVAKKGERTTAADVDIKREAVSRTAVAAVAANISVNVTTQPPEVSGESSNLEERSQTAIQTVVSRESRRLKRLYEEWLKRDPALNGRLTVKFVILASGAVSNVSIVKSTTSNAEFDDMVIRYIKRWQFPPVEGSGPVEVVYPFVFEGQS